MITLDFFLTKAKSVLFLERLETSKRHILAVCAFIIILYYRISILLSIHGKDYIGDENQWINDLRTNNLSEYLKIKDAGYFVLVPRLLLYIIYEFVQMDGRTLHLYTALIATGCSVSVIYLLRDNFSNLNTFLLALVIGFYPTYGLLTWMNLSYYIFIPTLLTFLRLDIFKNKSLIKYASMIFLVTWVAKPQLLLSLGILLLIKNIVYTKRTQKLDFSLLILIVIFGLIIVSRFNTPIETANDTKIFSHLFVNLFYIPVSVLLPIVSVALIGYLKMAEITFIEAGLKTILSLFSIVSLYGFGRRFVHMKSEFRLQVLTILAVVFSLYLSFFAESNSIFGNTFFWDINCRSCVYDRHIFPFFITLVLLILYCIRRKILINLFLATLLLQQTVITYFAYDYLFVPVLKL
jgi:hypothetical protein